MQQGLRFGYRTARVEQVEPGGYAVAFQIAQREQSPLVEFEKLSVRSPVGLQRQQHGDAYRRIRIESLDRQVARRGVRQGRRIGREDRSRTGNARMRVALARISGLRSDGYAQDGAYLEPVPEVRLVVPDDRVDGQSVSLAERVERFPACDHVVRETIRNAVERVLVRFDLLLDLGVVARPDARFADVDLLADRQVRGVEALVVFHQHIESHAVPLRDGVGRLSLIDRMYLEQSLFLPFRKGLLRLLPHDGNLEYLSRFQAFGRVRVVAADRLLVRAVGFTERVERFPGLDRVHVVAFACDRDHALRLPGLRAGPRKAQ